MAIPKIKATYSLDAGTIRSLERTAKRWGVSKSEVLRRAIRTVENAEPPIEENDVLSAWKGLQRSVALDEKSARRWQEQVRSERRVFATTRATRKQS